MDGYHTVNMLEIWKADKNHGKWKNKRAEKPKIVKENILTAQVMEWTFYFKHTNDYK